MKYLVIILALLTTGCMSKMITSGEANNDAAQHMTFEEHDINNDGVVDKNEFPVKTRNVDVDIAGKTLLIIIVSVCVLTFGLVFMTCSREKNKT